MGTLYLGVEYGVPIDLGVAGAGKVCHGGGVVWDSETENELSPSKWTDRSLNGRRSCKPNGEGLLVAGRVAVRWYGVRRSCPLFVLESLRSKLSFKIALKSFAGLVTLSVGWCVVSLIKQ